MTLKPCYRCVVAFVCTVASHAICDFAQADNKANLNGKTVRTIQITPEQRAALERQTRVFEDHFRRALTEPTDFDNLRKSSEALDSLFDDIRNQPPKRLQPPAKAVRKETISQPFELFKLPPAEPFDPATIDWKALDSLMFPKDHAPKKSPPIKRIRLPEGLMNWPMPKPGSSSRPGENLKKFDFSKFLLPELDKPLALPR